MLRPRLVRQTVKLTYSRGFRNPSIRTIAHLVRAGAGTRTDRLNTRIPSAHPPRLRIPPYYNPSHLATIHTTRPTQAWFLIGALKASTGLTIVKAVARIALTFLPLIMMKNWRSKARLKRHPESVQDKDAYLKRIKRRWLFAQVLLSAPILLFWVTIMASLERTPLTGRWRVILLSPEEEAEIAGQLAGDNWYNAVAEILTTESGPPRAVALNDWRYLWVRDTLRQLEKAIPILQKEAELEPVWLQEGDSPLPPPSLYPLHSRPRVSKWMCEVSRKVTDLSDSDEWEPEPIAGPPFSLVVVDNPEQENAFSYGFGAGGAGIVVYSGFLDDILSKNNRLPSDTASEEQSSSWYSALFGASNIAPRHPIPTPEQTTELAILLAHELSHLILSHHLETLSSGTVIIPTVASMFADVARTFLFPFTMVFGPFVNDAVGQLTKIGISKATTIGEYCTSAKQESEADVVSVRLLAYSGFDARDAVSFWESRSNNNQISECSAAKTENAEREANSSFHLLRFARGESHPIGEKRIANIRKELNRWELERRIAVAQPSKSSSGPWSGFFN